MRDNRTKGNMGPVPARSSALSQFEPGGSCGPIEDANEYEALIGAIADPVKREFLVELSRFATTWQYLSSAGMQIPPEIAAQVMQLVDLAGRERITQMRNINQQLMEFINKDDRAGSPIRQ